jgi:hypothetical protein
MPPILEDCNLPPTRKFCNVPAEIPSSFLTSFPFIHSFIGFGLNVANNFFISSNNSSLNCCRSSFVITSIAITHDFQAHNNFSISATCSLICLSSFPGHRHCSFSALLFFYLVSGPASVLLFSPAFLPASDLCPQIAH